MANYKRDKIYKIIAFGTAQDRDNELHQGGDGRTRLRADLAENHTTRRTGQSICADVRAPIKTKKQGLVSVILCL